MVANPEVESSVPEFWPVSEHWRLAGAVGRFEFELHLNLAPSAT